MFYIAWRNWNGSSAHVDCDNRDCCREVLDHVGKPLSGGVEFIQYFEVADNQDYRFCGGWYK